MNKVRLTVRGPFLANDGIFIDGSPTLVLPGYKYGIKLILFRIRKHCHYMSYKLNKSAHMH